MQELKLKNEPIALISGFKRKPFREKWHEFSQVIADTIWLYLKYKKMSIKEFAKKTNTSYYKTKKWLSGTYNFDIHDCVTIQWEFDGKNDAFTRKILTEKYKKQV